MVDHFGELSEGYFDGVGRHCGRWCRIGLGMIKGKVVGILSARIETLIY